MYGTTYEGMDTMREHMATLREDVSIYVLIVILYSEPDQLRYMIKKKKGGGGGWGDMTLPGPHNDAKNLVKKQSPEK